MNVSLIKKQLKKSSIKTIIERTKCSQTLVYDILKGARETSPSRDLIISTALDVLEKQKQQDAELTARFNEVVNYGAT
ncbi:hypothetical protein [Empedobacter falsenii]